MYIGISYVQNKPIGLNYNMLFNRKGSNFTFQGLKTNRNNFYLQNEIGIRFFFPKIGLSVSTGPYIALRINNPRFRITFPGSGEYQEFLYSIYDFGFWAESEINIKKMSNRGSNLSAFVRFDKGYNFVFIFLREQTFSAGLKYYFYAK